MMGKKIWVSYFFMKNPYMKFQNPSMYGLEVMLCIKKRNRQTHGRTDARTNVPEAICPSNFFEVGGITSQGIVRVKQIKPEKYHDESNTRTQQIQYVDGLLKIDGMANNTTENLK